MAMNGDLNIVARYDRATHKFKTLSLIVTQVQDTIENLTSGQALRLGGVVYVLGERKLDKKALVVTYELHTKNLK